MDKRYRKGIKRTHKIEEEVPLTRLTPCSNKKLIVEKILAGAELVHL
jgi:hypothetical protein